jgi:anti-anti-sigma regulatory factor
LEVLLEAFEKIYVDGVFVIEVNLTRAILNEAIAFRKILEEEINSGHTKLVIDLSKCAYIDSTFFGAIIIASKMLINIGYRLKVIEPNISGEYLFTINTHNKINTPETITLSTTVAASVPYHCIVAISYQFKQFTLFRL